MHPHSLIRWLALNNKKIKNFNFSFYEYKRNTVEDERVFIKISREKLLDNGFELLKNKLPNRHEIAFHSNLEMIDDSIFHLPLFDMATSSRATLEVLKKFLPPEIYEHSFWFDSGRSFHGYSLHPISKENWIKLMGLLLLVNQKDMKPIVDPRWIGHRLIAGYSALRWTRNTEDYLKVPTLNYSTEEKFIKNNNIKKSIFSDIKINNIY